MLLPLSSPRDLTASNPTSFTSFIDSNLFIMQGNSRRKLVFTTAGQTGDVYHVAGGLALDDSFDILVPFNAPQPGGWDLLLHYYHDVAPGYRRVTERELPALDPPETDKNSVQVVYQVIKRTKEGTDYLVLLDKPNADPRKLITYLGHGNIEETKSIFRYGPDAADVYEVWGPQYATFAVAELFKRGLGNLIHTYSTVALKMATLHLTPEVTKEIFAPYEKLPPLDTKNPVLLLWSRYTGTNTPEGYGPAGDSDVVGQKQIYDMAISKGWDVITIGHDPTHDPPFHSQYHIGEFYIHAPIAGKHRGVQLSFLLALMERYPGRLIQTGQKTGGMDGGALIGIPTLYIEDERSGAIKRMLQWVGAVPFYQNVHVSQPPTLIGKALRPVENEARGNLPVRQARIAALLFMLRNIFAQITGHEPSVKLTTILEADEEVKRLAPSNNVLAEWEAKIRALSETELKKYCLGRGYVNVDLDKIAKELDGLWAEYARTDVPVIVRSGPKGGKDAGEYVERSAL